MNVKRPAPDVPSGAGSLLRHCALRTQQWQLFRWYWGDAIAIDGLLAADAAGVSGARQHVINLITRWLELCPPNPDDVLAPGRALVDLASAGDIPSSAVDRFIGAVARVPVTDAGVPLLEPHRPAFRFGICIDAIYHLPVGLAAAARARSDRDALARAVALAGTCMDLLRCRAGWAQWYDTALARNNSVAWTRGLGWAALGLLDLITVAGDTPGVTVLGVTAAEIVRLLAGAIGPDGVWQGVLGDDLAEPETSTSAFFVAAALHPALSSTARPERSLFERAAGAVKRALDSDGTFRGASADVLPSFDRSSYRHVTIEPSPWGQGAALRALAALGASCCATRRAPID